MKYNIIALYSLLLSEGCIVKEVYHFENKFRFSLFHQEKEITWEVVLDDSKNDVATFVSYMVSKTIVLPEDIHQLDDTRVYDAMFSSSIPWERIK
jgi:hypothetical protein